METQPNGQSLIVTHKNASLYQSMMETQPNGQSLIVTHKNGSLYRSTMKTQPNGESLIFLSLTFSSIQNIVN
jgi:hypothetical protein